MPGRHLILMRHASAAAGSGRDFDRPLTRRGEAEARRVGERLRAEGPLPDRVLVSSALRCRATWDGVAQGLSTAAPPERAVEPDDRLYDAPTGALLDSIHALAATAPSAEVVLVLAHNPGISLLARELGRASADDDAALRDGFTPATIAVFAVAGDWASLSTETTRLLRVERPDREDPPAQ